MVTSVTHAHTHTHIDQDPNTIVHETAPSGDVYAVTDKSQGVSMTLIAGNRVL